MFATKDCEMFERVITFGDSWPAGAELLQGHQTFGEILAKSLNIEFNNFAQESSSIDHMILQLQHAIESNKHSNSLAIFFLTECSRTICFDKTGTPLNPLRTRHDEDYIRYLYNDHLGHFRANVALLALQSMCKTAGVTDYYIHGWTKFPITLTGIDTDKIFDRGTCLNLFKTLDTDPTDDPDFRFHKHNRYIKPNISHPNQRGHRKIAEELLDWLHTKNTFKEKLL